MKTEQIYWMLLIAGIIIRYIIGQRRFKRRGLGGLQHFNNYFIALITLFIEWVGSIIAMLMMLIGFGGLLIDNI